MRHSSALVLTTTMLGLPFHGLAEGQSANGNVLSVMPTKAFLDDTNRACTFTLLNRGSKAVRYRLVLWEMEMTEAGVLEPVSSYERSAKNLLKFAPREVLIEPGTFQKIKVVDAGGPTGAVGEFRSHLAFEPVDVADPLPAEGIVQPSRVRIELKLQTALSVPIFVRRGTLMGAASPSKASVAKEADGTFLRFVLNRIGERSVRGDCVAWFVASTGGPRRLVGEIRDLPIYFPNLTRTVTMPIDAAMIGGRPGQIIVEFSEAGAPTTRISLPISQSK